MPKKCHPLGIIEYDLVPFNVVDNESETILLSNNYITTGVKFFSLDDYHDSQDTETFKQYQKWYKER